MSIHNKHLKILKELEKMFCVGRQPIIKEWKQALTYAITNLQKTIDGMTIFVICANDGVEEVCLNETLAKERVKEVEKRMIKQYGVDYRGKSMVYVHIHEVPLKR